MDDPEFIMPDFMELEQHVLFNSNLNEDCSPGPEEEDEDEHGPHPLLIPSVLERVFRSLLDSHVSPVSSYSPHGTRSFRGLLALRKVARVWNDQMNKVLCTYPSSGASRPAAAYTLRNAVDVKDFGALVPSSPTQSFARSLHLKYNEVWSCQGLFRLLNDLQSSLTVLEIDAVELQYFSVLSLPRLCPGLQVLILRSVDTYPKMEFDSEAMIPDFKEFMGWGARNVFPKLREIQVRRGTFTKDAAVILGHLLSSMGGRGKGFILKGQSSSNTSGLRDIGEAIFSQESQIALQSLWIEHSATNEFVAGMETSVSEEVNKNKKKSSFQMMLRRNPYACLTELRLVQKSGVFLQKLTHGQLSTLSDFISLIRGTLKRLVIVNSASSSLSSVNNSALVPNRRRNNPQGQAEGTRVGMITFPKEGMKHLELLCLGNVSCSVPETSTSLGSLFPKLDTFQVWVRIINDIQEEDKGLMFHSLFPPPNGEEEEDSRHFLRNFHLYTTLTPQNWWILGHIANNYRNLKCLLLEINGASVLFSVVNLFASHPIGELALIFYEPENSGIRDFDAALGGFVSGLGYDEDTSPSAMQGQVLYDKDNASLADWPCLTRLSISYRNQAVLSRLMATQCLLRCGKLRHLELRHFFIKENLLIYIIKKCDLSILTLGYCEVPAMDPEYPILSSEFGVSNIVKLYNSGTPGPFTPKKKKRMLNLKKNPPLKLSINSVSRHIHHFDDDEEDDEEDDFRAAIPRYASLLHHFDYDDEMVWW